MVSVFAEKRNNVAITATVLSVVEAYSGKIIQDKLYSAQDKRDISIMISADRLLKVERIS